MSAFHYIQERDSGICYFFLIKYYLHGCHFYWYEFPECRWACCARGPPVQCGNCQACCSLLRWRVPAQLTHIHHTMQKYAPHLPILYSLLR